ncbi:hypothetical protein H4S06_001582 [Coemansia sp. BCRC 34490]|nr:hypothetical protein H4S06_001582 [Coemansia sp. BCRC 34490]
MLGVSLAKRFTKQTLTSASAFPQWRFMNTTARPNVFASGNRAGSVEGGGMAGESRNQFLASALRQGMYNMGSQVVGRSVPVISGGPAKSYARLNRIMMENNVRKELNLRKRYEKPKYKRQRLRFESHARRFKEEVGKKVKLVMRMKDWGI